MHVHEHISMCLYMYKNIHMHIPIHIYIYVCMCMKYVRIYIYIYNHIWIWICVRISDVYTRHRTHKSIWINESSANPKSTSNQSSKSCTVLQYPSKNVYTRHIHLKYAHRHIHEIYAYRITYEYVCVYQMYTLDICIDWYVDV